MIDRQRDRISPGAESLDRRRIWRKGILGRDLISSGKGLSGYLVRQTGSTCKPDEVADSGPDVEAFNGNRYLIVTCIMYPRIAWHSTTRVIRRAVL